MGNKTLEAFAENARLQEQMSNTFQACEDSLKAEKKGFESLVADYQEQTGCTKSEAISHIARTHPEAHAAYIEGVNS